MGTHVTDLNWEHGALVIIDMQNDFSLPGGAMPVAGAMEVIPSISDVLCQARKSLVPIIHPSHVPFIGETESALFR